MKKALLLLLLLLTSLASYASDFEVDGICYNITSTDDKTVEVTEGGSYSGDVVIPEKVTYSNTEYTVTKIGDWVFAYCESLTSIVLPTSLTTIGDYAFIYCRSLASIELPASLNEIGNYAFYECNSLASIELPASLTSIGNYTFCNCSSLTSIELPASLTSIGAEAFRGCASLTSIELSVSVTEIGSAAFCECTSLQEISVAEANENYTSIDGVLYDKNVTTLMCCPCGKTGEFTVPVSVTEICDAAFWWCSSLESIELPASVTEIGNSAFSYCSSLQEISVSEANENYTSIDGVLYDKNVITLICCPGGKSGEVSVPSSVTTIGFAAFRDCASLTNIELPTSLTSIGFAAFEECASLINIELPASVTEIGNSAFADCSSLTSIELPASVTDIGNYTFGGCRSLTSIELPTLLNSIGSYAFYGCRSLTSIELPASLTSIDSYAFYSCRSLETVTNLNLEPPTLGSGVFESCPLETVYVPNVAVMDYKSADGWNEFNIVGIDVTGISDIVVNGCDNGSVDCYTLQGVRVKTVRTAEDVKSLRPGIYIVNGKKVVVR